MKQMLALFLLLNFLFAWSQNNFDKAEKLYKDDKLLLAQPLFENYLKENPNHIKTLEYLAEIAFGHQDWDKAILYMQKLKLLKPSDANYCYKYGGAIGMKAKNSSKMKALGMIDEIRTNFEKAIILNPKHIEARWALIEFYLQLPAFFGGSESKAKNYSAELLRISSVDGYLSKGHIEEYFNRYKEAEENYKKAYEIGKSKTCFQRLYNLYTKKMKDAQKAQDLKQEFEAK